MAAKQVILPASPVPMLLNDRGLVTNQVITPTLFLEETTASGGTAPGSTATAFVAVMG